MNVVVLAHCTTSSSFLFDELGFVVVGFIWWLWWWVVVAAAAAAAAAAAVVDEMGCGGSKVDDLALVKLCKERKDLIRAAADHRYALSAAHVSYFRSLKDVGDALRRFVEEELVNGSGSASPVLTLPSDEGKKPKRKNKDLRGHFGGSGSKIQSSSASISDSADSHIHSVEDDEEEGKDDKNSHLHFSTDSGSEMGLDSGHIKIDDSPLPSVGEDDSLPAYSPLPHTDWGRNGMNNPPQAGWDSFRAYPPPYGAYPPSYGVNQPYETGGWASYGGNSASNASYGGNWDPQHQTGGWGSSYGGNSTPNAYYMKKSAPAVRTVIHEQPEQRSNAGAGQWPNSSYGYSSYYMSNNAYDDGRFFGFSMSSPPPSENKPPTPPPGPPPPPSPQVSAWDFLNPFDAYDNGYPGFYSQSKYGYGSLSSSPDSNEVREREGIPDLEEETENEISKEVDKGKKLKDVKPSLGEGSSKVVPPQQGESSWRPIPSHSSDGSDKTTSSLHSEVTSRAVPLQKSEAVPLVNETEEKRSIDLNSTEGGSVRKKGVGFQVDKPSTQDAESSQLSSLTTISLQGTRDLQDVVNEIRDEFEIASSNGKEVALMLEVGKLPYQPTLVKVIISRILYLMAPSSSPLHPPRRSLKLAFRSMKLAKSYYEEAAKDAVLKFGNLSSTLEELYAWEKKLYKEVKEEERLRVIYEKKWKKLKMLDEHGAESSKIDTTRDSVRKLLTKLNVCIRSIEAVSFRIHKLRDEELQPQITELVHGLVQMWKTMLKCHQKQFQAVMQSKIRTLRANTGFQRVSNLRATLELEMELLSWCSHFNDWINTQRSYVESLNGWLLRCLDYEPEETPDGIVPFSPGRLGAPSIFIICNDWYQAMDAISEKRVATAMHNFASNLRQLSERQDEEQHQRLKADYLSKDFEKRLKTLRMERGKGDHEQETKSGKGGVSIVRSESGVSPLDDLKVDLDSMRQRLEEEKGRHKEAVKLVHDAAASSLQGGLVPIFKALENFTSEALKAHEQIRLQNITQGS